MQASQPGKTEFVIIIALLTSLIALSTDAMLPALPEIGHDLQLTNINDAQLIISTLFLGLALGQLVVGPVSDTLGRKPLVYIGMILFALGSLLSYLSNDFQWMLIGRFLQGLGAALPRTISMALTRDCYSGREMAQIMSFSMLVFILVPAIAPALGQGIMLLAGWRSIFLVFMISAVLVLIWFAIRMPETLPPEKRTALSLKAQWHALKHVLKTRLTMAYTLSAACVFGAFLGYLNSAQQILQDQYELGEQFPLYFAMLALTIGFASFINARLVIKHGMRRLSYIAFLWVIGLSLIFLIFSSFQQGHPSLLSFMAYCMAIFLGVGVLFANLNTLAMEPLDQFAGLGASVIGSLSTLLSVPLGIWVGHSYNGTVIPLVAGFLFCNIAGFLIMKWVEQKQKPTLHATP